MSIAFIIFLLIIRLVKYQNREYMLFCLFAHSFNTTFFIWISVNNLLLLMTGIFFFKRAVIFKH